MTNNTVYNKKVKEHFLHPKNMGEIKNPDGVGKVGNLKCGDVMQVAIKIKEKKIKDIKFLTFGCAAAIASSSAMTEIVKGKTINEAKEITNEKVADYLGGFPIIKMHCSNLAADALKKAICDYEEKN